MRAVTVPDALHRMASENRIPISGCFELSPVCNFACRMCYVRRSVSQIHADGKRLLSWKEWVGLAEQCKAAGTLYLLLTGGEPFLYPGFRELYQELHQMGFLLTINTNGSLIDRTTVEWLKRFAPMRVNITLYGTSEETYRRVCGQADGYRRAVSAIGMLKDAGIPVVINASMIPENEGDLEEIVRFGQDLSLNTRVGTYMFPPVRRTSETDDSRFTPEAAAEMALRKQRCQMDREAFLRLLREQMAEVRRKEREPQNHGPEPEYMRCRAGRSSFWVSWEGTMTACGILPFPVEEHPFERAFSDCWEELTEKVRNTPVLQGCTGCEKAGICNPCAGTVYAETGSVSEKAPYLCRVAECMLKQMEMITGEAQCETGN